MRLFVPIVLVALLAGQAAGEDLPYPAGQSTHEIEGLETILHLPDDLAVEKPASLVIILHGAGGTATGMAGALREWPKDGYVVCAPKSVGQTWALSEPHDIRDIHIPGESFAETCQLGPLTAHIVGKRALRTQRGPKHSRLFGTCSTLLRFC